MKRFLMLSFILLLGLALSTDSAFSAPRTESYRSAGTAGMFKTEYDRLSDNPAYVGAKLKYIEYDNSITKEKTNIFTMADGLNEDGRFIAGGIGDPGLGFIGGIGGYLEAGLLSDPYECYYDTGQVGNAGLPAYTRVDFDYDYEGSAEGSDVYYLDTDADGEFDRGLALTAEEEYYRKDSHLNAKIAAGGIMVGDMTLGVSFERNTDIYDDSSSDTGETIHKGGFVYTDTDLFNNELLERRRHSFDRNTTISPENYLLTIGSIIPMGGFIEQIEAALMVNYLRYERKENNPEKLVYEDPGIQTTTYPGFDTGLFWNDDDGIVSDKEKQDGLEYGLVVQTREKLFGCDATTYIMWMGGGLTPNKERKAVYQIYDMGDNYSNYFPGNPDQVDSQSTTGTYKYTGDGIAANGIMAGIVLRKNITESLAGGAGFSYTIYMSENKYKRKTILRQHEIANDGDGIVLDDDDYTATTTGSYTDNFTDTVTAQEFTVPIGFDYQATPTLSWRFGVIHTTRIVKTSSKWERGNIRELYYDEDNAGIPGDENDNDGPINDTSVSDPGANPEEAIYIGDFAYDTGTRSNMDKQTYYQQSNSYFFGIGYSVEKCVQIDVLLEGSSNRFQIDAGEIAMSATYVVQ